MPDDAPEDQPPPTLAINPLCRKFSFALLAISTVELFASDIVSLLHRSFIWAIWLLPFGWLLFYGIVYAICIHISKLDPENPTVKNYPQFGNELLTVRQPQLMANIGLIVFPAFMTLFGTMLLYEAANGQLHN